MTEQTKHDRIFLQICYDEEWCDETWCEDRIHESDVEYIRKELHDQQIDALEKQLGFRTKSLGEEEAKVKMLEQQLAAKDEQIAELQNALVIATCNRDGATVEAIKKELGK